MAESGPALEEVLVVASTTETCDHTCFLNSSSVGIELGANRRELPQARPNTEA
jgi:hypothetical protein